MKIEQDLRIVIKAAANASKNQDKSKTDQQLIEEWMKKNPAKAKYALALVKRVNTANSLIEKADADLKKKFGLGRSHWRGEGCFTMDNEKVFQEAGGKIATKLPKFSEDEVIAQYAAAKTKAEAKAVLKKYGIVWE